MVKRGQRRAWIGYGFCLLVSLLLLSGCVDNQAMRFDFGPDRSLVYGYIDMSSAPTSLEWANMIQVRPRIDKPYYHFSVRDGVIFLDNVPPARFVLWEFGGTGKFEMSAWHYRFPYKTIRRLRVDTARPGLHYIGSWKYVRTGPGLLKHKDFKLVPSKRMNEKSVLQRLLPEAKNPKWRRMIERRLAQL